MKGSFTNPYSLYKDIKIEVDLCYDATKAHVKKQKVFKQYML